MPVRPSKLAIVIMSSCFCICPVAIGVGIRGPTRDISLLKFDSVSAMREVLASGVGRSTSAF